jgi:hypothetical protein
MGQTLLGWEVDGTVVFGQVVGSVRVFHLRLLGEMVVVVAVVLRLLVHYLLIGHPPEVVVLDPVALYRPDLVHLRGSGVPLIPRWDLRNHSVLRLLSH